jgi:hypothetical protein
MKFGWDAAGAGEPVAGGVPEAVEERETGTEQAELVRERLDLVAGLRKLEPAHEEVSWWHKRTRMVLEAVVEGNRGLRGALKAFDSITLGTGGRGRHAAGNPAAHLAGLDKAENLLKNLLHDLEAEAPDEPREAPPPSLETRAGEHGGGTHGASEPSSPPPELPADAALALFKLAEAVERDPGLSLEERHDFRLDVRSLHNELLKHHPDAGRVLNLIETLSRFEVDLRPVRRAF